MRLGVAVWRCGWMTGLLAGRAGLRRSESDCPELGCHVLKVLEGVCERPYRPKTPGDSSAVVRVEPGFLDRCQFYEATERCRHCLACGLIQVGSGNDRGLRGTGLLGVVLTGES